MKKLSDLLNEQVNTTKREKILEERAKYDSLLKEHLYNIRKDLRKFVSCVSRDFGAFKSALSAKKDHKVANVISESLKSKMRKWSMQELNEVNYVDILDDLDHLRLSANNRKVEEKAIIAEKIINKAVSGLEEYFGKDWEEMIYSCSEEENEWAQDLLYEANIELRNCFKDIGSFLPSNKKKSGNDRLLKEHFPSVANKFSHILDGMPYKFQKRMTTDLPFFNQVKRAINDREKIDSILLDYLDL